MHGTAKNWSPEQTENLRTETGRREKKKATEKTYKENGQAFLEEAWVPTGAWKDANVSSIAS